MADNSSPINGGGGSGDPGQPEAPPVKGRSRAERALLWLAIQMGAKPKSRDGSGSEVKGSAPHPKSLAAQLPLYLVVLLVIVVAPRALRYWSAKTGDPVQPFEYAGYEITGKRFVFETATTAAKIGYGLRHRLGIFPSSGMLFQFAEKQRPTVHLADMYFPVMSITIDERFEVLETHIARPGDESYRFTDLAMGLVQIDPADAIGLDIKRGTRIIKYSLADVDMAAWIAEGGRRYRPLEKQPSDGRMLYEAVVIPAITPEKADDRQESER